MYDRKFYNAIRPGVQSSAAVVVPMLIEQYAPKTVIDIGCGEGWWGYEFAKRGVEACGIDGPHIEGHCEIPFTATDLSRPGSLAGFEGADMVVCLEVAEHLPPERGEFFVEELCDLAPVVVFSAAIPGQGGVNHINCRWQTYWSGLFADQDYACDRFLSAELWDDDRVEPWYRQNIFIAQEGGAHIFDVIDVVHPRIWEWKL